jgi:hypothetical protein
MDTLKFIYERFGIEKKAKSPIGITRSRYGGLPILINELGFTIGAEIGVSKGRFSKHLCIFCPKLKLYSIDPWELFSGSTPGETKERMDELYLEAKARLASLNCQIVRDWSTNAVKRFADNSLDFVYIDAAHDYGHVYEDIREWSKKVKKGGIVAGHDYISPKELLQKKPQASSKDYNKTNYGVKRAVDTWVKKKKIKHLFVFTKDLAPSWFYVKK